MGLIKKSSMNERSATYLKKLKTDLATMKKVQPTADFNETVAYIRRNFLKDDYIIDWNYKTDVGQIGIYRYSYADVYLGFDAWITMPGMTVVNRFTNYVILKDTSKYYIFDKELRMITDSFPLQFIPGMQDIYVIKRGLYLTNTTNISSPKCIIFNSGGIITASTDIPGGSYVTYISVEVHLDAYLYVNFSRYEAGSNSPYVILFDLKTFEVVFQYNVTGKSDIIIKNALLRGGY